MLFGRLVINRNVLGVLKLICVLQGVRDVYEAKTPCLVSLVLLDPPDGPLIWGVRQFLSELHDVLLVIYLGLPVMIVTCLELVLLLR